MKKKAEPTTLIPDSQSVKNAATATEEIGFDGGKLIKGRKRFVLVDTSGATLATRVLPANVHDGQSALAWWASIRHHPLLQQVKRVFIDGGFRGEFVRKMAELYQIEVIIPQKVVRQAGKFCIHATRWVVEHSISWITNNRRLARCYERKKIKEESFILLANSSCGLQPGLVEGMGEDQEHEFEHETRGRGGVNLLGKAGRELA